MKTPTKVNQACIVADASQLNSTGWERAMAGLGTIVGWIDIEDK